MLALLTKQVMLQKVDRLRLSFSLISASHHHVVTRKSPDQEARGGKRVISCSQSTESRSKYAGTKLETISKTRVLACEGERVREEVRMPGVSVKQAAISRQKRALNRRGLLSDYLFLSQHLTVACFLTRSILAVSVSGARQQ